MNRPILAAWAAVLAGVLRVREWPVLRLVSFNAGSAHTLDLLADAIALQETGDQWRSGGIIAYLHGHGFRFITGRKSGQSSTPLAYDPNTLRLIKVKRWLLAERQNVGEGAGPAMLKTKWAIGGLFEHLPSGRHIWIFSVHYVASQQKPKRMRVALAMTGRLRLLVAQLARATFILGDFNGLPDGRALQALRRLGLQVNHVVGAWLGTHGKRAIDQCWWTPRRWIRLLHHYVVKTASDHKADVTEFEIRPRRKHR